MNELGTNNSQRVTIVPIQEKDISEVARLQKSVFQGYLNARIGLPYIQAFISWFQEDEDAIALCAVDGTGKILGFVVGAPIGYISALNKKVLLPAATGILLRPWLFLDPHFRQVVAGRLRDLFHRSTSSKKPASVATLSLPGPVISLVGIGVHPSARGKQIGERLMFTFEEEAIAHKARSMRLSVYPDNAAARKLYENVGWRSSAASFEPKQAIQYYKMLKTINHADY